MQKRLRPLAPAGGGLGGGGGGPPGLAAPADTPSLHTLLRTARDEDLRRAAFEKCQRTPASNLAAIDALVEVRLVSRQCALASCGGMPGHSCRRRRVHACVPRCHICRRPSAHVRRLTPVSPLSPSPCQARHEVATLMGFPSYASYQVLLVLLREYPCCSVPLSVPPLRCASSALRMHCLVPQPFRGPSKKGARVGA